MTLSVCLIVKDEQDFIENCLNSVRAVADEIILVDTGCSDQTIALAQRFEVKVFPFEWINDFSVARNKALKQASGDWILHLDADETLDPDSAKKIGRLIADAESEAFNVSVRNYHPPQDMIQYLDSKQIRLFRNRSAYRYRNAIHEQIAFSIEEQGGRIEDSSLLIHHYGYRNQNTHKARRNRVLLEQSVRTNPEDAYLQFKLGETYKALQENQAAKDCFLKALGNKDGGLSSENLETLYLRLAQLELAGDNYQQSVEYARKSLAMNANNALSLYLISIGYLYTGRILEADDALKHLKRINRHQMVPDKDIEPLIHICENYKKGKRG